MADWGIVYPFSQLLYCMVPGTRGGLFVLEDQGCQSLIKIQGRILGGKPLNGCKSHKTWASEMAPPVKMLTPKPDNLGSISKNYMVQGENPLPHFLG